MRKISAKGLALTKLSEGFKSKLYNDVARYCTIGYGHLVKKAPCDGNEPPQFADGISEAVGSDLLVADMSVAQYAVMTAVETPLTDGQFAALADFVYNVGTANFSKSSLLRAINKKQYENVPYQLRRWILAGGKEWPGLKLRREREIELFFDGFPEPRTIPSPLPEGQLIDIRIGE